MQCAHLPAVLQVLCMTVECGWGGQKFQEQVLAKVSSPMRTSKECTHNRLAAVDLGSVCLQSHLVAVSGLRLCAGQSCLVGLARLHHIHTAYTDQGDKQ